MPIAALFAREVIKTIDVAQLGESHPAESTIVESARTLLTQGEDEPLSIHEVDGGYVVAGSKKAVLFADTGDIEVKDLEPGESDEALDESLTELEAYMPGHEILAIQASVKSAQLAVADAQEAGLLDEAQLDEYMQVTPYNGDGVKVNGARVRTSCGSIYLSTDDFFKAVPHYGVAEYLLSLALADALKEGKLDALVAHVQTYLKDSPKTKALEVELVESEQGATGERLDESMGPARGKPKGLAVGVNVTYKGKMGVILDIAGGSATVRFTAGKKEVPVRDLTIPDIAYEDVDIPGTVVVVFSENTVELRADNKDGELLASASFNANDPKSMAKAYEDVMDSAGALGYDTSGAEEFDESVVMAAVNNPELLHTTGYTAVAEALDAGNRSLALATARLSKESHLVQVAEGFSSRKHVKGRKPSQKTIPRKANSTNPKPPVDVGPGDPKSVSEWLTKATAMPLTEFAAAMLKQVDEDTFRARVEALVEAYGKTQSKDLARKITAVNPIIKARLKKGVSLEEAARTPRELRTLTIDHAHADLMESLRGLIPNDAPVSIVGSSVQVVVDAAVADAVVARFPAIKSA